MTPTPDEEFPSALRAAITARGLSLERVRRSLAERGVRVSVATLSYWQTGRSRPERASSLAALGPLEEVLDVPRGFLASKVAFARGEAAGQSSHYQLADAVERLPEDWNVAGAALAQLGLDGDDGLTRVSIHDRLEMRADGTEKTHQVRTVLLARRDGVDRLGVWYDREEPGAYPIVRTETNCRLGRVLEFREYTGVVAELLLERPLRAGETTIIEHRLESFGESHPQQGFWRAVVREVREIAIEVRFDPVRLPVSAEQVSTVDGVEHARPLVVGTPLQALFLDCSPGVHAVRWSW